MKKIITLMLAYFTVVGLYAQTGNGNIEVALVGGGMINYSANSTTNAFGGTKFHIMPLAKISDRMFLLSEIEIETEDGVANFGLETTNLYYIVNNALIFHAGRFLPKFGNYRGRYGEGFINRFVNNPVGSGDGGIGPMVETGLGMQGGFQIGTGKINYDFYLSGGPQLLLGSAVAPDEAGQFDYEAYTDNNNSKAIGGRVGILPFSDSSLELGFSFETVNKTGEIGTPTEDVSTNMYAIDLEYYKVVNNLTLRFMGEYKGLDVSKANYLDYSSVDINGIPTGATYTFNNNSTAYYTQLTIRPSGTSNKFLNNVELAGRYSSFKGPKAALWGGNTVKQTAIGLDYYFSWSNLIKFEYNIQDGMPNQFLAQVAFRF